MVCLHKEWFATKLTKSKGDCCPEEYEDAKSKGEIIKIGSPESCLNQKILLTLKR